MIKLKTLACQNVGGVCKLSGQMLKERMGDEYYLTWPTKFLWLINGDIL